MYSLKSITFAGFLGSPIASGYLMYSNFKAINEPDKARNILIISIIFTVLFFVGVLQIPENILDKIPKFVFSLFTTGVIYYYTKRVQGDLLKKHEVDQKEFYSKGRVFFISLALAIVVFGTLVGSLFLSIPEEYDRYEEEMVAFYLNEEQALEEYNQLETKGINEIISTINQSIIPIWEKNIDVLKRVRRIFDP